MRQRIATTLMLLLRLMFLLVGLLAIACAITYGRTLIPSFEPMMNAFYTNHPMLGGAFGLLAGIGPDITFLLLGFLGLTYLAPRAFDRFARNKSLKLWFVASMVFFSLATIIDNQMNREEQEQWQANLEKNMTNLSTNVNRISVNQEFKPNLADRFLNFFNVPNRITHNISASPKQAQQLQVPPVTSNPESRAPTALSADEITMIHETATSAATGIQQDFDKLQSKIDERYRQIPGNMNSPSVYSQKTRESAASGPLAYQPHAEAVQSIINVANAHLADPHWELIIRILQLRSSCIIGVAPGAIQGCISQLRAVASQAKP